MKRRIAILILAFLAGAILSCGPSHRLMPVDPQLPIEKESYSVRPPSGQEWRLARDRGVDEFGPYDVLFVRIGPTAAHSSYGLVGEMPAGVPFESPEDFLDFQINNMKSRLNLSRFHVKEETFDLDDWFGEYSIRYCRTSEDSGSPEHGIVGSLLIKTCGYVFVHPFFSDQIIRIEYSERSEPSEMDSNFDAYARTFFRGLTLNKEEND